MKKRDGMIGLEASIGYCHVDKAYWVHVANIEDEMDFIEEGPFDTQKQAETWIIDFMESRGGICMGKLDDTLH